MKSARRQGTGVMVSLIVLTLFGCCSSLSTSLGSAMPPLRHKAEADRTKLDRVHSEVVFPPGFPIVRPGEPVCIAGKGSLGRSAGAIDVEVKCVRKDRQGRAVFEIDRESLAPPYRSSDIRSFGLHPIVRGRGAIARYGGCRRGHLDSLAGERESRAPVYCWARAKGPITVEETILVDPTSTCNLGVRVSAARIVHGRLRFRQLFRRRAVGC